MPKVKPERIAGIVALSYLVLIPAGALIAYRKVQIMERDLTEVWVKLGMEERNSGPLVDLPGLRRFIGR